MQSLFRWKSSKLNPLVTAAIVGVWLVLMGLLVKEEYLWSGSKMSEAFQIAAAESDDWFLIRIRGAYSGFGRSRQFRADNGWILRDDLKLSLNIQGRLKPVTIVSKAKVNDDFRLISFELKVGSGIVSFSQTGQMEGRNTLVMTMPKNLGGGTRKIRVHETPRISRSLGLPVPFTGLKVGDEITVPVFDPFDGQKSDAFIRVEDRAKLKIAGGDIDAWLVKAFFRTAEVNMWIDEQGRLVKGRLPLGITVTRSTKDEITSTMAGVRDLPEMMGLAAVPVEGTMPDPKNLKILKLEVVEGRDLNIAADDLQRVGRDDGRRIKKESLPMPTFTLPSKDPNMEGFLTSSLFIQSDHKEIAAKAKEIVGNEKDPVKAAQLITAWVHNNLKKVPTPSVPDAVSVLRTKQGDCNEHAVLWVALARAVGLPAQIALGLVYMEDGFYYHAWCTCWTGEKWVTADPLMNQLPADASHVALLYGDVDKHMNVLSYLGKLKLRILETG